MDAYEATGVVFSRIQALDPDNAAKIMGLLLIQDHGDKEMIRLAFGPEALLHSVILKARKDLGLLSPSTPLSLLSRHNSSRSPSPWAPQLPFSISNISDDGVVDDEFLLHEQQLSLLNEQAADPGGYWDQGGLGWKPCLYFARGFCKNGSSCRFVHGPADDTSAAAAAVDQQYQKIMLLRSKSQRLAASAAAAAFPYSPAGSSSCKNLNLMLQQLQNDSQRAAAAALMLENDDHKFMSRPRMERDFIGMVNPGSRQIYLTFPADSTFTEEDVSNYFSIYGSVQDVRIPYQQKRMFGFVTFVYPETVKLILAKGNPHFVCDARVLVKPYKEKGKISDEYRKQQHGERFDFSGCTTPTELDSRGPFGLQQLTSPKMMYGGNNYEVLLRRKMEEQQAAAKLQQAMEMQGRRFMGLQLLDIKNQSLASPTAPILSSLATPNSATFNNTSVFSDAGSSNNGSQDEDTSLSPAASAALSTAADKQQTAVNSGESEPIPVDDINCQQSAEHNLPDSPFASPTKSDIVSDSDSFPLANEEITIVTIQRSSNGRLNASSLQPPSPHEGMNSLK